ncbi:hypothetical protein JRQ81_013349 [Phrynocephalus forsythii]|uniref:Uncharacterized protein n=1 Tax=Phrynocephalus forsythii TaxID=171643 RepID=A0A9Q0XZP6_9SAUR|nr:hypothetical protein JRQ81_013349 [Phrynocephalus forsythii]
MLSEVWSPFQILQAQNSHCGSCCRDLMTRPSCIWLCPTGSLSDWMWQLPQLELCMSGDTEADAGEGIFVVVIYMAFNSLIQCYYILHRQRGTMNPVLIFGSLGGLLSFFLWEVPTLALTAYPRGCDAIHGFPRGTRSHPSRLRAHLAAISFFCGLRGCQDPCWTTLKWQAIKGWEWKSPSGTHTWKPIMPHILKALLKKLVGVFWSSYEPCLFRCTLSLAFFGAFCVGELVASSYEEKEHLLTLRDLNVTSGALVIRLWSRKTDQRTRESHFILKRQREAKLCPVRATWKCLEDRGK